MLRTSTEPRFIWVAALRRRLAQVAAGAGAASPPHAGMHHGGRAGAGDFYKKCAPASAEQRALAGAL